MRLPANNTALRCLSRLSECVVIAALYADLQRCIIVIRDELHRCGAIQYARTVPLTGIALRSRSIHHDGCVRNVQCARHVRGRLRHTQRCCIQRACTLNGQIVGGKLTNRIFARKLQYHFYRAVLYKDTAVHRHAVRTNVERLVDVRSVVAAP
jgi:hypothetical protein